MRFDLSNLRSLPEVRSRRWMLWGGWGFVVVFASVCVAAVSYGYLNNHGFANWPSRMILGVAVCAVMIVFGFLYALGARAAARFLEVNAEGFRFDFGDWRPWTGSWGDPGLRLKLVRFTSADGNPSSILAWGGFTRRAYLTPEAFAELIEQASASGLKPIDSRPAGNPSAILTTISR